MYIKSDQAEGRHVSELVLVWPRGVGEERGAPVTGCLIGRDVTTDYSSHGIIREELTTVGGSGSQSLTS